jgi:isopenicillin-N epimerase
MPTDPAQPAALRAELLLDPDLAFLNHGSYGATPRAVMDAAEGFRREMEANPVAFLDPNRGLTARLAAVRARLAQHLSCDPGDLALVENATEGVNIVARSLRLGQDDEVLTTDHEYGACEKLWARIAAETGARIVVAPVPLPLVSEAAFTQALASRITPRTRVLFLSHVTSATALTLPIAPIVAEARARGIFTLVDGAHGPGQVALDLTALGADAYAGNAHKWWMAPKGTAFLHARRAAQAAIRPLIISHGWQEGTFAGPFGGSRFTDALEMRGTRDMAAFLALPAALDWQAARDWPAVSARAARLLDATEPRIRALTGLAPLSSRAFRAPQMASFPLPRDTDPAALKAELFARGIEVPCFAWSGRPFLRLSAAGYTQPVEVDRLVAALAELLPSGLV